MLGGEIQRWVFVKDSNSDSGMHQKSLGTGPRTKLQGISTIWDLKLDTTRGKNQQRLCHFCAIVVRLTTMPRKKTRKSRCYCWNSIFVIAMANRVSQPLRFLIWGALTVVHTRSNMSKIACPLVVKHQGSISTVLLFWVYSDMAWGQIVGLLATVWWSSRLGTRRTKASDGP